MSSYRRIIYHIVFRTKHSRRTLNQAHSGELYAYMMGYLKNKNCFLYRINGMEDHIHLLCEIYPDIALTDFIRDLKTSSSIWMKKSGHFQSFDGWSPGYAALTYSWRDKDRIANYIRNQQEHHRKKSYNDELRSLLLAQGIDIDERYFP